MLGNCEFDPSRGLLLRGGVPVPLRPKTFALLAHLAQQAGRVVGKSELMDAIWPNVIVTEDSLTQTVRDLRKGLGVGSEDCVRTIAKRGYLLALVSGASTLPQGQPRLAVLRFSHEGAAADEPLVNGFAEDLIAGLARFRRAAVLAHNSSFTVSSDANVDWRSVGRQLGVDYLVRGKIDRNGDRLHLKINLIDASTGAMLWSETFDGQGASVFEIQSEITRRIMNRLVVRLDEAALQQAQPKPPSSLAAYELLLRGLVRLRGYREDDNQAALELFKAALERDPDYALAHAYVALAELIIGGFAEAPRDLLAACVDRAQLAVTLSPEEPRCHRVLASTLIFSRKHEAAQRHLQQALDLNPCDADTIVYMGLLLTMRGKPFEALALIDQAQRINPVHPMWYNYDRAIALYSAGEYSTAVEALISLPIRTPWRMLRLAVCHAQLGNGQKALQVMSEIRQMFPDFDALAFARHGMAFEHQQDIDHFVEGVEKALRAWQTG